MQVHAFVPEYVAILLSMATTGLLVTSVGFGVAWFRARDRAIKAETMLKSIPAQYDAERFDRLDLAVDTIAVELERISEAERFQTKLLVDRQGTAGR